MGANDTYQLAVQGTVGGQMHVHTLHFRDITGGGSAESLVAEWKSAHHTNYRNIFRNDDNPVEKITARQVCGTVPLGAPYEDFPSTGQNGSRNPGADGLGDKLAPWLAQVFQVRTSYAGRSRRGRFYLGGLSEGVVAGAVIGGIRTGSETYTYPETLKTRHVTGGGTVSGWMLVVHSRKLAAVANTQCQNSSTPVAQVMLTTTLSRMMSRKAGSGT